MDRMMAVPVALGKFQPLERIICHDDFDRGSCGWTDLTPNFRFEGFLYVLNAVKI